MSRPTSLVLWKAMVLTALCAVATGGLWWWGLVRSPRTQIGARAQDALVRMERTIDRELSRAEMTGLAFGDWWSREQGRLDDPVRLQNVISFLEKGAIITNLILSREDGDSACIVRRDGEWNLIFYRAGLDPRRYLIRKGRWEAGPVDPGEAYDARERYWYRFGASAAGPAWTPEAYPYFCSTVGGFTYTVPVRSAGGRLEGVIGVDVSLEDLTHLIWEHQPTPGSRMLVTDRRGLLLVPPRTPEMLEMTTRFKHYLKPLSPPFLASLDRNRILRPSGREGLLSPGHVYINAWRLHAAAGTPEMRLHVAIPEEDLFPGLGLRRIFTFLLAMGAVLGVAWSLLDLHLRVVLPIHELAAETSASGPAAAVTADLDSDVWDIRRVGQRLRIGDQAVQERDLLRSQVEHNQRVDAVGMMAPGIVHDVNNHLTLVLGQIALCRSMFEDHPGLQPRLRAAEGATLKCAEALRGLLDYSRPDTGRRELMDLNALVEGGVALLKRVLAPGTRVEVDLGQDIPPLYAESIKLQQVLVNLGMNARDAMSANGLLTIRTSRSDEWVTLEVKDNGSGMSEEVQRRAFEPFYTTKAKGKGTGLGLAMVANLVAAHGGRIRVNSAPGAGTAVRIDLPLSLRKNDQAGPGEGA